MPRAAEFRDYDRPRKARSTRCSREVTDCDLIAKENKVLAAIITSTIRIDSRSA